LEALLVPIERTNLSHWRVVLSKDPNRICFLPRLGTNTDAISETFFILMLIISDDGQNTNVG
jgi:hypothetical protein